MTFKTQPYKHQLDIFNRFKDENVFALFCDMGTGKSKVSIDIAAHKFEKGEINAVLVIAPNNVHTQWITEQFPAHCAVPYKSMVYDSGKLARKYYDFQLTHFISAEMKELKVLAINVEALSSKKHVPYIATFVKRNKVFTIFDEATRGKNPSAIRTKNLLKLNKYGSRCILTGTPVTKSPFNLWSLYEFLKPDFFECNYFVFQHRYGVLVRDSNRMSGKAFDRLIDEKTFNIVKYSIRDRLNAYELEGIENPTLQEADYDIVSALTGVSVKNVKFIEKTDVPTKYKNLDHLRGLIAPITASVKKEECLDLPPKVYETLYVSFSKEQERVYKNLKQKMLAEYDGEVLTVANKLSLATRLMQVCGGFFPYVDDNGERFVKEIEGGNAKLDALIEDLEEVNFETTRVIIWAAFTSEIRAIYNALHKMYTCAMYYGEVSVDERNRIQQDFKDGKYEIFIGNTATAGFGLNLQNATLQYYYSNNFRVEDRLQAEDRSHRNGVKSTCVYKDLVIRNSMDEKVFASIRSGRDLNDTFRNLSLRDMIEDKLDADLD